MAQERQEQKTQEQKGQEEKISEFSELLRNSERIVFFGGAGVSTASGIPDFRSPSGLYRKMREEGKPWANYDPEELLSHDFFMEHTDWFYEYYREAILHPEARPNVCHQTLAEWEEEGRLLGVITQNIDGLHQLAGSHRVTELHGTVHRNFCMDCHRAYSLDDILGSTGVPHCRCGGVIKPAVTLYQEALPDGAMEEAIRLLGRADLLLIAGTSLAVYPAAGLIHYFGGETSVLINLGETPYDHKATLHVEADLAQVFAQVRTVFREEA